ncbi:peptidase M14 [bacterium 210820-DFI.6.37]|nr:peptidase M14 [bacterium 210820-DFI.6.37]
MRNRTHRVLALLLLVTVFLWPGAAYAEGPPKNIVDETDKKYSYNDMVKDLKQFEKYYSDRVTLKSLGKTADKREIYCVILGNPDAKKQIVVQASMHAREYMNTQMIMECLERYVKKYETGSYKKMKYKDLFNKVAVYIVPMVNPDGVTISQYGIKKIKDKKLRKKLKKMKKYGGSYKYWKANARGVDLNRNFKRGWKKGAKGDFVSKPASERYPGKKPLSEKESIALNSLMKSLPNARACLSYHSRGQIIYWYVGQKGSLKKRTKKLADMAKKTTGYKLVAPGTYYPGRGEFGNYCNMNLKIPNLTIETGKGKCPLSRKEFSKIYKKNKTMIEKTAYLVK